MEADGSSLYAEGRTLAEIATDVESVQPMAALLAVRFVGEHVDGSATNDQAWSMVV
jgi:hypothetical protein